MMPVFDAQVHFGDSLFGRGVDAAGLDLMQSGQPEWSALLIPAKPRDYLLGPANEAAGREAEARGWSAALRVDPWRREEALALIASTAASVLFLHPFEEQFSPTGADCRAIIEAAAARGMIVMMATGYLPFSHAAQVRPLVEDFPQVRFLLTHGAQINICGMHMEEAYEIFENCENALFETSGIYRQDYIERAIRELGAGRVLFGSGAPFYDRDYEWKRMEFLELSDEARALVVGGNLRALLA